MTLLSERQLFCFWQFNGDNSSFCNYHCPYCYGRRTRNYQHHWNSKIDEWEKAFERLNREIYFVFSYGEAFGSHGFYDCVDMIGEHPDWTLNVLTNLSYNPERLIASRLGQDKRVFVTASWHPQGAPNRRKAWVNFKRHLLMLKEADIPVQVMYLWAKPQIEWFPEYFRWLDKHDFRVNTRRHINAKRPILGRLLRRVFPRYFSGKYRVDNYTELEKKTLYAFNPPKLTKYTIDLASTYGISCSAGKDMILVEYDGTVKLCADCCHVCLGNIFDPKYKLNKWNTQCPTNACGGGYGILHLSDEEFGAPPERLWNDTFISQAIEVPRSSPVAYPKREEILECLK